MLTHRLGRFDPALINLSGLCLALIKLCGTGISAVANKKLPQYFCGGKGRYKRMKKLKGLSLILCLTMILSVFNFSVCADNTVKAYITISKYGEIVKDKNGELVAEAEVTLTGKESYTLDDAFKEAHELYYEGGADEGYATADSEYGLSVTKVWGDTSGKFGYQMNLGTVAVWGPTQAVSDGDYIDLCIYENGWPDTESYAKFDAYRKNIDGDIAELTLYESYYGENWETLFKPCQNAEILMNGKKTDILTDENGKCKIYFDEDGEYIISAKKTKMLKNAITGEESTVNALTAPVCVISVTVPDEIKIIHNIAKKAMSAGLSESDQMYWLLGDIAGYFELYPNSRNVISQADKQKCIDKIIAEAETTTSAAVLAKSIIALRSLGYDPKNTYNSSYVKIDIAEKLSKMIDAASADVTNVYTLPYVIIAMQEYLTAEQKDMLVNAAITQKSAWQDTFWGVDGATPMLLALAPYYDENDSVKTAVTETVELIKAKQSDSGAVLCIDDWENMTWGDSSASTGLAVAGLSAVGVDPKTVITNGNNLIDGLMSRAKGELDGFVGGTFDNEQAFRGLIQWELSKIGKRIYDFSAYPENAAYATRVSSGGGGGKVTAKTENKETEEKISVTVSIMSHDKNECNNSYTYKSNSAKYTALAEGTVEINKGQTVYDATVKVLNESGISYEDRNGYIASIGNFSEFDHGDNSGWMFKVNGKHQSKGCKDIELTKNSRILWYYTDDYTQETGSEDYQNTDEKVDEKVDEKSDDIETKEEKRVFQKDTFSDVKENDWHFEAVKFVYENNIMSGTDKGFEPDAKMTRAMLVSVLFRLSGEEKAETDITFGDVASGAWYTDGILWAASVGIVSGVGDNNFAPDSEITREQMAVILYNFAKYKNQINSEKENGENTEFNDFDEISDYAQNAILWANAAGFVSGEGAGYLNPKGSATRAQIASLLMRYCEAVK